MKKRLLLLVLVGFVLFIFSMAYAGPSKAAKKKHADKNNDGIVDRKELKQENRFENQLKAENDKSLKSWEHSRAKVNTQLEAKYDLNNDGWLQPEEARQLEIDKNILIKTNGQAKVNTALEAEYDKNKDGIIDLEEAKLMKESK